MGGAPAPAPMDGASDVPPGPDPMAGDPMGGDTGGGTTGDPMGGDPGMGGDPMGGDVPPDGNGQLDPDMGGDPMGGDPGMEGGEGEGDDSTMSIIDQLSPEDREAVRSYAESMLSRDEAQGGAEGGPDDMGGEPPMDGGPDMGPDQGGQPPMMEQVVFTKKQLKKLNEAISIMEPEKDDDEKRLEKKKGKSVNKKSPFNSPKFK